MMKMKTPKTSLTLIAFGLVCVLQPSPSDARPKHAQQLIKTLRRIDYDETRKSIFLHSAKYGVQTHIRDPLIPKLLGYANDTQLSQSCLDRIVTELDDIIDTFYAGFSYACTNHDQYSVECLEEAQPNYFIALGQVRTETEKCLISSA